MRATNGHRLAAAIAAISIVVASAIGCAPKNVAPSRATPSHPATPSATPSPTPTLAIGPDGFAVLAGRGSQVAPAQDRGTGAGLMVDDFGFELFRKIDAGGNLCFSPASIALDLAMVRLGARGQTATEMDAVLHKLGGDGQDAEIAALLAGLASHTEYDDSAYFAAHPDAAATPDHTSVEPSSELLVSNQAFVQRELALDQAYLDRLNGAFGAGVGLLDFKSDPEAARALINRWAGNRTRGRIPNVLQPGDVDDSTRLALANAIYLKAAWQTPFDPAQTKPRPFKLTADKIELVQTMAGAVRSGYSTGTGYRAVELAYGTSGLSMLVVLPSDMKAFSSSLDTARLRAIVDGEKPYLVDLTLPTFSLNTRFNLTSALGQMGMPSAFSSTADFSGMTTQESLRLQLVVHQANIDVVEKGTTAAAVTVTGIATTGGGSQTPPRVTFRVDQPFLYFVFDRSSSTILFMGRVSDPRTKS